MTVKLIVAVDQGNSIGWATGSLPWRIPQDMQRFKDLTTGHRVLMGRKTFESLKRPAGLANRKNIVLTRDSVRCLKSDPTDSVHYIWNIIEYIDDYRKTAADSTTDLWIAGGAEVYMTVLKWQLVDEIYLTQVHTISGGDVILPFDLYSWKHFVAHEQARGDRWEMTASTSPTEVSIDSPRFTFITLKKTA